MIFLIFESVSLVSKLQTVKIELVVQLIDACHGIIGSSALSGEESDASNGTTEERENGFRYLLNNCEEESCFVPLRYSDWYWMENLRDRRLAYLQRARKMKERERVKEHGEDIGCTSHRVQEYL
jgi:hypothetical protein